MVWELNTPVQTSATLFPEGFLKGISCVRCSWQHIPEIIDYCKSVGQDYYDDLIDWAGRKDQIWLFVSGGVLHASLIYRGERDEYFWTDLVGNPEPVCRIEDIDVLL